MATINQYGTTGTQEGDIAAGLIKGGVYQPQVQPSPQGPSSLSGTMTQPPPQIGVTGATVQPPPTQPQMGSNVAFQDFISKFVNKSNENADLVNQKNLLLKHLFDSPLTPEEKSKLPQSVQMDIESGSVDLIKLNVQLINDQLQNRVNQTTKSIQYLLDGYNKDQELADKRKQDAKNTIMDQLQTSGSAAFSILSPQARRQLEQSAGLSSGFLDQKTFSERNLEASLANNRTGGGTSSKPATATEIQNAGYFDRVSSANKTIDDLGSKFTGVLSYFGQWEPNFLKSADRQQIEQAERNFVNAVLRRESGAAISPSEFDSAAKQYFPQPGDSPEVVAQKSQNRAAVVKSLGLQSGNAIQTTITNTSTSGTTSSGLKYTIIK